jgi:hypothetical protein
VGVFTLKAEKWASQMIRSARQAEPRMHAEFRPQRELQQKTPPRRRRQYLRLFYWHPGGNMVGSAGLEPATSCL